MIAIVVVTLLAAGPSEQDKRLEAYGGPAVTPSARVFDLTQLARDVAAKCEPSDQWCIDGMQSGFDTLRRHYERGFSRQVNAALAASRRDGFTDWTFASDTLSGQIDKAAAERAISDYNRPKIRTVCSSRYSKDRAVTVCETR